MSALFMWGLRFDAQPVLRVDVNGAGAEDVTLATSTDTDYFMSGDGQADDLLEVLETAIESHSVGPTCAGTLTAAFKAQTAVTGLGVNHQLLWSHANTTADPLMFGYTAVDTSAAATLASSNEPQGLWRPGRKLSHPDERDRQVTLGGVSRSMSGAVRVSNFGSTKKERDLTVRRFLRKYAKDTYADATAPYNTFESAWFRSMSLGRAFRVYEDETDLSTSAYTTYRVRSLVDPLSIDPDTRIRWAVQNLEVVQV